MPKHNKLKCAKCPEEKRSMTPWTLKKHIERVHDAQKVRKDRKLDRHTIRWCKTCQKFIRANNDKHFEQHMQHGERTNTPIHLLPKPEPEIEHPPVEEPVNDQAFDEVTMLDPM